MVANVLDTVLLLQITLKSSELWVVLGPRVGVGVSNVGTYRHILTKAGQGLSELYGLTPAQQEKAMKERNILSRNPLGSGGVGKKSLIFAGSRSGYVA